MGIQEFDQEVKKICQRVEKALLAARVEEIMRSKNEEKECLIDAESNLVLNLELFSYEPYETTKKRYKGEFSKFCAFETKNISRICSDFRERNKLI